MATATKEAITESSDNKKRQSVYSKAGFAAFNKARSNGVPFCFTEGTVIYKMFPSGKRTAIGHVKPPVKIEKKVICI